MTGTMTQLASLRAVRRLRDIDVQVARLLGRIDQGNCPQLPMAAAFASWATGQGHTCLPLSTLSGLLADAGVDTEGYTDIDSLRQHLLATTVVGQPDADAAGQSHERLRDDRDAEPGRDQTLDGREVGALEGDGRGDARAVTDDRVEVISFRHSDIRR